MLFDYEYKRWWQQQHQRRDRSDDKGHDRSSSMFRIINALICRHCMCAYFNLLLHIVTVYTVYDMSKLYRWLLLPCFFHMTEQKLSRNIRSEWCTNVPYHTFIYFIYIYMKYANRKIKQKKKKNKELFLNKLWKIICQMIVWIRIFEFCLFHHRNSISKDFLRDFDDASSSSFCDHFCVCANRPHDLSVTLAISSIRGHFSLHLYQSLTRSHSLVMWIVCFSSVRSFLMPLCSICAKQLKDDRERKKKEEAEKRPDK